MHRVSNVLCAFVVLCPVILRAEEAPLSEDDLNLQQLDSMSLKELLDVQVIVSSATPETVFETPSTVSVIDKASLRRFGFWSVSEALAAVAGVTIERTFQTRQLATFRGVLQDHHANKLLVLIDGIPAWMAVTGHGDLDRVHIDEIERIEVLKGPASVLHGTNAYAGAVNIVLRRPGLGGASGDVGLRLGPTVRSVHAVASGSLHGLRASATASALSFGDGRIAFTDEEGNTANIGHMSRNATATIAVGSDTSSGGDKTVTWWALLNTYELQETHLGIVPSYLRGAGRLQHRRGSLLSAGAEVVLTEALRLRGRSALDWSQLEQSTKDDDLVRAQATGNRSWVGTSLVFEPTSGLEFHAGLEGERRHAVGHRTLDVMTGATFSENNMADRHVWEYSAFGQADVDLARLFPKIAMPVRLLVGGRYTRNELYLGNGSLRATGLLRLSPRSSVKLVAGQSFRAPSLFELHYKTLASALSVYGNPDLKPERSDSIELAYLAFFGPVLVSVLGFLVEHSDTIQRMPRFPDEPSDISMTYENGESWRLSGSELEVKLLLDHGFAAFVTTSYNRPLGERDTDRLAFDADRYHDARFVPTLSGTAGVSLRLSAFSFASVLSVVGNRNGPLRRIGPEALWDASVAYEGFLGRHAISAKNILDARRSTPEYVRQNINAVDSGPATSQHIVKDAVRSSGSA